MRFGRNCARRELCLPYVRAQVIGSAAMRSSVAFRTQRGQVLLGVVTRMAAEFPVVHLEIRHRSTGLAPPAISTQDLLSQPFIRNRIQPQAGRVGPRWVHDAFSLRPPRNACCWSPGKNLKNLVIEYSNISGFPLSRLAPARKSAQIISRQ
jgi:hypothetical protein